MLGMCAAKPSDRPIACPAIRDSGCYRHSERLFSGLVGLDDTELPGDARIPDLSGFQAESPRATAQTHRRSSEFLVLARLSGSRI